MGQKYIQCLDYVMEIEQDPSSLYQTWDWHHDTWMSRSGRGIMVVDLWPAR